ncbi:MAG: helix-hairpin-helix domain-containing protein [Flavobacteriaceae bacterium]
MVQKFLKSHFQFNRSEQGGILVLSIIIIILIYLNHFFSFSKEHSFDIASAEMIALQKEMDSLRVKELEARKPKLYSFNPNFITDFKAYSLGMSAEEFDKLKIFREEGKWINSISDFKKVTGVSEVWLDSISPYFKFPEWVTNPKPKKIPNTFNKEPSFSEKIDLNKATKEQLQKVRGIGEALSNRILDYKNTLGGFTDDVQLYFVYGLDATVVHNALQQFTVKTPKEISKWNINSVSASDIATLPGISFATAKNIWEFVQLRNGIKDLNELSKIEGITPQKLQLIKLYLLAE